MSLRWHPAVLIAIGATAALAATVLLAASRVVPVAVIVAVLLALAWVAMHSSLQTWATEVVPAARASVVSLFAGVLFAGSALAAIAVSGLAESGEYGMIFVLAAATTLPLGVLASIGRARWRRNED